MEVLHQLDRLFHRPQLVRIGDAAGKDQRIIVIGRNLIESGGGSDRRAFFVVYRPLDLALLDRCEGHLRAESSEEHTSELQSLMRHSYAVLCLKKKNSELHKHTDKTNSQSKKT